jgi:serpin B
MKTLRTIVAALMILSMVGCSGMPDVVAAEIAQSDLQRQLEPEVDLQDLQEVAAANRAFALDLYQVLKESGRENLFYSPHSISTALAMTYAGARGTTEAEMARALRFTLGQERLHPAFNGLDLLLESRGEGAEGKDDQGFRLHVVNALWGQKGFGFEDAFLDTLAQNYGAGLRLVDYRQAAESARQIINAWVSEQTEERIQDLIPAGALDATTRLVLTNAIYFNAAWQYPFTESRTADEPFTRLDGSTVSVPMMAQSESLGYVAGDGYQAVDLLYSGGELSMTIVLPAEGRFEEVEAALDADQVSMILDSLRRQQIALAMPKFEFESEFSLPDALRQLGMVEAFTSQADFAGMTGGRDLAISDVVHKAFVSVDEKGTEAAAATAVIMKLTSAPAEPIRVSVDRPFIFLIRDIETGAILFLGRVLDPS